MYTISLTQFRNFFPKSPYIGLGDDFYILDANILENHQPFGHACRFDGFMAIYCLSGHVKISVNLEEYDLRENTLLLNLPGNILKVHELDDTKKENMHYVCLLMSKEFVGSLVLDVNKIFTKNLSLIRNPCMILHDKEVKQLCSHVKLIHDTLEADLPYKSESIRVLLSSVFYFFAGAWSVRAEEQSSLKGDISSRSRMVFERFIKLVSEYHTVHRNVGFYADKLCLTPKYLSRVIKDATGRSAPDWIDAYVILEAKNLLKYSGKAIKEIVYQLNFPNQSVFYKFFKARTGMTPTEYRNS